MTGESKLHSQTPLRNPNMDDVKSANADIMKDKFKIYVWALRCMGIPPEHECIRGNDKDDKNIKYQST